MIKEINWEELEKPFTYEELDWVGVFAIKGDSKSWIEIAPYVTNRAVQDRLDRVLGKENWSNSYDETAEGVICNLSIMVGEKWITKSDGAEKKGLTPLKTACSVAMKRAAVQWGIGRYLYYLPRLFGEVKEKSTEYYRHTLKNKDIIWYMPNDTAIETVKRASGEIK